MTIRTATEFCTLVENRLGYDPFQISRDTGKPLWKVIGAEAGKVNKKIASNPGLYTWENLELAVAYLFAKRQAVVSPTAVCWAVEEALERAVKPEPTDDLAAQLEQALAMEMERTDPEAQTWVGRLTRASGNGRREVMAEWTRERSGCLR